MTRYSNEDIAMIKRAAKKMRGPYISKKDQRTFLTHILDNSIGYFDLEDIVTTILRQIMNEDSYESVENIISKAIADTIQYSKVEPTDLEIWAQNKLNI